MEQKNEMIIFAMSKTGASHLPSGLPCQDYSLCVEEQGIRMIIVCDGHGSKSYVRSHVGARLATEVTKRAVIQFVKNTPVSLFLGKKGSVTTRPVIDDSLWGAVPKKPIDEMTEIERLNYEQDKAFFEQVKDIREQDSALNTLFNQIYLEWLDAIKIDSQDDPFTEEEKKALGNLNIVKAYGTTLMTFVATSDYWFSFHIGDGRIVTIDYSLSMHAPVPWDYNCFQNYTTSLCNENPVRLFRYAFDGTGEFPAAVFCCSDGVEDSFGDYDIAPYYLHNWYLGLLNEFCKNGIDSTLKKIDEFLPILSQKGSKDDISFAGIIDISSINLDIIVNRLNAVDINNKLADLELQKNKFHHLLDEIEQRIEQYKQKNEKKKWILFQQ